MEAKIIIKNYRCFIDEHPLTIELKDGFIALVGQNNSGKSSFLKFFYELRGIWDYLQSITNIRNHIKNSLLQQGVSYLDVYDPKEIFSDGNERPLSIEIEVKPPESYNEKYLSSVIMVSERKDPNNWSFHFKYGPDNTPILTDLNASSEEDKIHLATLNVEIKCTHFLELMGRLSRCLYVGSFRNAINEGAGKHFDLVIGTSFIETWNNWKTGAIKSNNKQLIKVVDDIKKVFGYDKLEINSSGKETLQLITDNGPYKLRELGSGISQFIVVLGNVAINNPSYVLIDEPELNLHPSLQIDFLTSIASYTKNGIIFATHSVGLARATSEQIYSFQKIKNYSEVKTFEDTKNYAEFIGELSFSSYKEMGVDKILLVEGVTDVKTFQQFLRKINKDHKIVILPLGGDQLARGGIETELGELKRLSSNIYAIVDSERQKENEPPLKAREEFGNLCKKLGFEVCITKMRSIENYFPDYAIKKACGTSFSSLDPYGKLENESSWGKSKNWRIAREMKFGDIENTDIGKFLKSL